MPRYYFQFMSEGAGTAGTSAHIVTADTFTEAWHKFYDAKHYSFYGGIQRFETAQKLVDWVAKNPNRVVHGGFQVPTQFDQFTDGEVWRLYEETDVRGFGPAPELNQVVIDMMVKAKLERNLGQIREEEKRSAPPSLTDRLHTGPISRIDRAVIERRELDKTESRYYFQLTSGIQVTTPGSTFAEACWNLYQGRKNYFAIECPDFFTTEGAVAWVVNPVNHLVQGGFKIPPEMLALKDYSLESCYRLLDVNGFGYDPETGECRMGPVIDQDGNILSDLMPRQAPQAPPSPVEAAPTKVVPHVKYQPRKLGI